MATKPPTRNLLFQNTQNTVEKSANCSKGLTAEQHTSEAAWRSSCLYGEFHSHGGTPIFITHFRLGFSLINHPAIGVPPFMETSTLCRLSILFLSMYSFWASGRTGKNTTWKVTCTCSKHPPDVALWCFHFEVQNRNWSGGWVPATP